MNSKNEILLPGLAYQYKFLSENYKDYPQSILVIGYGAEPIANKLSDLYKTNIYIIVEDYESLINSKILTNSKNITVKLMNFESTDFSYNSFDLVYAQASISSTNRNKIVKEVKKILKPGGYFCVGEVALKKNETPRFVKDIFDSSGLLPLHTDNISKYYTERNFSIAAEKDLSDTLHKYYSFNINKLDETKRKLPESEKSYYKKLLNKISHESKAYLNLGGHKYIGFKVLLLQKGDE